MECGTPVIGKIPNMVPDWMETKDEQGNIAISDNGIWTNTTLNIPELIATYMKVWLEDSIPTELTESIKQSTGKYTPENQKEILKNTYSQLVEERIQEFNNILAKATAEA